MSRPTLGALTLFQASYTGFGYPARAQTVTLLAADPTTGGNAVLQSSALAFRTAQVTWTAMNPTDAETARGYHHDLSVETYTDHDGNTYSVRVTEFSAAVRVGDIWDCSATLVEVP